ncbi:MAG: nucleoside-diphosphate sugar epimerase/dehydratase [Oscillospiraceae bacterium]|nr:nucleoside-diphosphate sugar epimerase/dehydratase [Oscillospiraceae bacterium]
MYNKIWEFVDIIEALRIAAAVFFSFISLVIIGSIVGLTTNKSCYLLAWIFLTCLTLGSRFSFRLIRTAHLFNISSSSDTKTRNIMIIGAGHVGNALIREIERDRKFLNFKVVCLIDDDPRKINRYIGRIKVVGGRESIIRAAERYQVNDIIIAMPSASDETRHEIINICLGTSCVIKALPSCYQILNQKYSISMLKKIEITDLLKRPQIELDLAELRNFICGKTVLVTGAGGSIGSELCRQLATYKPGKLILFEIYENSVYYIQNELKNDFPELDIVTLIGSVRDEDRLDYVYSTYRPDIVYHAAAHKHVPLMEGSPNEAVKNNVLGTLNAVCTADKYGVSRFVLISTDKAVNPVNVMGATKRICEMIIQYYNKHSATEFVAVRFGNVLGSNGSVIPVFLNQIENGGPVTVTHPEIIRYFMTISEAVSLVLQAGTYAHGGEIFVLDMGEPVKILSLAENMIRLSGLVPYKDINIEITGLRPGEKISEELLIEDKEIIETSNKKIFIEKPIDMNDEKFIIQLERLKSVMNDESHDIRPLINEIVPAYNFDMNQNVKPNSGNTCAGAIG